MEYFDAANMGPNLEGGHNEDDDDEWGHGDGKTSGKKMSLPLFRGGLSDLGEGWFSLRRDKDELAPNGREGFLAPLGISLSTEGEVPPAENAFNADRDRSTATEDVARMLHGVPEFSVSAAAQPVQDESWHIPRAELSDVIVAAPPDVRPDMPALPAEELPAPPARPAVSPSGNVPPRAESFPPRPDDVPTRPRLPAEQSAPQPPAPAPEHPLPSGYSGGNTLARLSGGGSDYYYYHSRYNNAAPLLAGVVAAEHIDRRHQEKKQEREIKKLQHADQIHAKQLAESSAAQIKLANQNRILTEQVDTLQLQHDAEKAQRAQTQGVPKASQERPAAVRKTAEHLPPPDQPVMPPRSVAHAPEAPLASRSERPEWESPQPRQNAQELQSALASREFSHRLQPELLREQTQDARLAAYTAAALHAASANSYHAPPTAPQAEPVAHRAPSSSARRSPKIDSGLARAWFWFVIVLIVLAVLAAAKAML